MSTETYYARRSPTSPVVRVYEIVSPRTCSANITYTAGTYRTYTRDVSRLPRVSRTEAFSRTRAPRYTWWVCLASGCCPLARGASVKVAITRVHIASGVTETSRVYTGPRPTPISRPPLFPPLVASRPLSISPRACTATNNAAPPPGFAYLHGVRSKDGTGNFPLNHCEASRTRAISPEID
ncbi:hypothetical protein PUN28_013292 [Cardiocondyla obscurior]|uniref:Uncharacterized protein n=1 Tax=Cardiocondyla obscurior TaxID=286306 RepID=A0AAW2F911_9HYME